MHAPRSSVAGHRRRAAATRRSRRAQPAVHSPQRGSTRRSRTAAANCCGAREHRHVGLVDAAELLRTRVDVHERLRRPRDVEERVARRRHLAEPRRRRRGARRRSRTRCRERRVDADPDVADVARGVVVEHVLAPKRGADRKRVRLREDAQIVRRARRPRTAAGDHERPLGAARAATARRRRRPAPGSAG